MTGGAILATSQLSVGYGERAVVRDVSVAFPRGQMTAIIGPNGCGKSTLLKAMSRVIRPVSGVISLNDMPLESLPTRQIARQLAHLPQGPIAPEGLTVRELVAQGRYPHLGLLRPAGEEDARTVDAALRATNLTLLADRPVDVLSGGQRQRAWIAMTLAQDTQLILLDEPTTYLDLKVQIDVMNCLRNITRQGRSLVVVLHELNLAAAFADHIVMMRDGMIAAQGSPDQTFTTERLAEVFGLNALVMADPQTGRPVCLPRMVA